MSALHDLPTRLQTAKRTEIKFLEYPRDGDMSKLPEIRTLTMSGHITKKEAYAIAMAYNHGNVLYSCKHITVKTVEIIEDVEDDTVSMIQAIMNARPERNSLL